MSDQMLPYGRQSISAEDIEAVTAVLRGDWLTTGPAVTAFETAVSELTGGHRAVSCTSGTAALHMAYAGLGIGVYDVFGAGEPTIVFLPSTPRR